VRFFSSKAGMERLGPVVAFVLVSLFVAGCGATAGHQITTTVAKTTVSSATARGTTTSSTPAVSTISLHDRVMAEQGRAPGSVRVERPATTTTTPGESGTTTTTAAPVAETGSGRLAVEPPATTNTVLVDGQTPLAGVWSGTAEQLASYLLAVAPSPRFTVPTLDLAAYYVRYCAEAGLRADLLWAQMIHETGYGMYGGDVSPEQNNYAGIGATGGGAPGLSFPTAEAGVMAQVAHMVAYVHQVSPVEWANATTDPRYDFVNPHGAAVVLADLNGRWAVPGTTYGQSIEEIARAINTR
jgi:hypothetical protein